MAFLLLSNFGMHKMSVSAYKKISQSFETLILSLDCESDIIFFSMWT